jgi:hypothetical protein
MSADKNKCTHCPAESICPVSWEAHLLFHVVTLLTRIAEALEKTNDITVSTTIDSIDPKHDA